MNKEIKSLYRVYRPKQFSDVIGQDHVTKTLTNQLLSGGVAHAYLFCGTRGTGKTSVAKIFASAVNCLNFKDSSKICGKCENCKKSGIDVFELDAASNNRVEDVREIIDKVKYPPIFGKYKVYIVDEVHMFSASAFNAFLKTLEEPPSHVIFILCTTEAHKLLPTVQSRCLRFDFRTVSTQNIEKLLTGIFKKESIESEPEAVKLISEAGRGCVRDALSFAETVSAYCGNKKITTTDVSEVLGAVDTKILKELLSAILAKQTEKIVSTVEKIFSVGRNASSVVRSFLDEIKTQFIATKDTRLMQIYKTFAELELNIKTAIEATNMFEGACLVSAF